MPRHILGWRKLFDVMGPSTNTVVQPDYDMLRPAGVTNHHSHIFMPDSDAVSNESFRAGLAVISNNMMDAVRSVMTCHPDYLVMGISAITFLAGGRARMISWRRSGMFPGLISALATIHARQP